MGGSEVGVPRGGWEGLRPKEVGLARAESCFSYTSKKKKQNLRPVFCFFFFEQSLPLGCSSSSISPGTPVNILLTISFLHSWGSFVDAESEANSGISSAKLVRFSVSGTRVGLLCGLSGDGDRLRFEPLSSCSEAQDGSSNTEGSGLVTGRIGTPYTVMLMSL